MDVARHVATPRFYKVWAAFARQNRTFRGLREKTEPLCRFCLLVVGGFFREDLRETRLGRMRGVGVLLVAAVALLAAGAARAISPNDPLWEQSWGQRTVETPRAW